MKTDTASYTKASGADDDSRIPGHRLAWMVICRAKCECGTGFYLTTQEAAGLSAYVIRDLLMDLHSAHLASIREQGRG